MQTALGHITRFSRLPTAPQAGIVVAHVQNHLMVQLVLSRLLAAAACYSTTGFQSLLYTGRPEGPALSWATCSVLLVAGYTLGRGSASIGLSGGRGGGFERTAGSKGGHDSDQKPDKRVLQALLELTARWVTSFGRPLVHPMHCCILTRAVDAQKAITCQCGAGPAAFGAPCILHTVHSAHCALRILEQTRGYLCFPQPLKLGSSPLTSSKGARVLELRTYRVAFAGTLVAFSIYTVCCITLPKPNPHPPSLGNLDT